MERGLLLFRLLGLREVCCSSQCEGRQKSVSVLGARCYLDDEGSLRYPDKLNNKLSTKLA